MPTLQVLAWAMLLLERIDCNRTRFASITPSILRAY
jgi:hypothetical protein